MSRSNRVLRLAAAFVLSPVLASVLVAFAAAMITFNTESPPFSSEALSQLTNLTFVIALFAAMIAVPVSLSVGLIVHAAFQRLGQRDVWPYVLAGALVGLLIPFASSLFLAGSFTFALYGVPAGTITAGLAWFIRRPDRDAPNPATPQA